MNTFDDVWPLIEPVGGWLTREQARTLYDGVRALHPGSTVVEIGSHQGRSTLALALAREDVTVVAVDPFVAGGKFGGPATQAVFEANLDRAGVTDRVRHLARPSSSVLAGWTGPVDLVFVDGRHDPVSTARDLGWARYVRVGGRLLVHDSFSSVGVTLALLAVVLPSRRLRYAGRTGSLASFERGAPSAADRRALLAQLPWWLRNVAVKVLLRLRLRPLARLAGHADTADPY